MCAEYALDECFADLTGVLFREGEQETPRKNASGERMGGLFSFRGRAAKKEGESKGLHLGRSKKNSGGTPAVAAGDGGFSLSLVSLAERMSLHKTTVVRLAVVPSEPREVWSMDENGMIIRWPVEASTGKKPQRANLGHVVSGASGAKAMSVCGRHVWISAGDITEIRDFTGRLMWKLTESALCFSEHGSLTDSVWCGGSEGVVSLFKQEELVARVQLKSRQPVVCLCVVLNAATGASELWVGQGRNVCIISEATNEVLQELVDATDSRMSCCAATRGAVWFGCDNGKLVRFESGTRVATNTVQPLDDRCIALTAVSGRLVCGGNEKAVRILEADTGVTIDSIGNAHEGAVNAIAVVEAPGKTYVWTTGADKTVAVWNVNLKKASFSMPVVAGNGRDESDELDDSLSDVSADRTASSAADSKSPRFVNPPGSQQGGPRTSRNPLLMRSDGDAVGKAEAQEGIGSEDDSGGSGGVGGRRSQAARSPSASSASSPVSTSSINVSAVPSAGLQLPELKLNEGTSPPSSGAVSPRAVIGTSPPMSPTPLSPASMDDPSSTLTPASRKKGKKRVMSKLLMAVQAGSLDKMVSVMAGIEAKHESSEGKAAAREKALDRRGPNRRTALHYAAQAGNLPCVEQLVKWGASLTAKDKFDLTPLQLATATDVKAFLLQQHSVQGVDAGEEKVVPVAATKTRTHVRAKSVAASSSRTASSVKRGGSGKRRAGSRDLDSSGDNLKGRSGGNLDAALLAAIAADQAAASTPHPTTTSTSESASETTSTTASPSPGPLSAEQLAAVKIQSFIRMQLAKKEATQLKSVRVKRKNIAAEMVKTEETYVRTLDVLVNKIRVAMSTQSFRAAGNVNDQDLKVIFPSSLSMLLTAHQTWLAQLQERFGQWTPQQCVGDLFLQLSPYLKMYIVYVSNFELATLKIRELRKKDKRFGESVHEIFFNLGDPTNDLASMLVTPVQRIPRYVLMLKDLLKVTSPQHPDYNNLLKAVKIMTDTTVLVDRKADEAKNAQKVVECSDCIVEAPLAIVQPNRKWIRDGPLRLIVTTTEQRPRYVFLFTDVLVLCAPVVVPPPDSSRSLRKTKKDNSEDIAKAAAASAATPQYRYLRELSLLGASVHGLNEADVEHSFVVRSPKIAFALQAASAADKTSWMKGITAAIDVRKDKEGTLVRGGSTSSRSTYVADDDLAANKNDEKTPSSARARVEGSNAKSQSDSTGD